MRVKTLEIRWHESLPIYALDYQQPQGGALKRILAPRIQRDPSLQPSPASSDPGQATPPSYRLATSGGDNNVRVWMVYPNILPPSAIASSPSERAVPHPPRVEYLATLSKHTATVNVVRFSPNGEFIASAGDDGMIAIWSPSDRPAVSYGNDYEKEHWRMRIVLKCTSREVYDLAWSPNGEWIIAGSTDNTARIFNAADGTCVREITEHSHYVQGVAWDPMNEFVATQSSDRSVHVYSISTKRGPFDRTPSISSATPHASQGRPNVGRHSSIASDADSVMTSASELKDDYTTQFAAALAAATAESSSSSAQETPVKAPPTPTASIASSVSAMYPPKENPQASRSRRSSFSSAANPGSPALSSRNFGRSPSPMPPLPAIRTPAATPSWASTFDFSPDGALLLTPAGHFDDPSVVPSSSRSSRPATQADDPPIQPKRVGTNNGTDAPPSSSSVFIYSRANFSRPPVAHLPGHKTASVAVKFSPSPSDVQKIVIEVGKEQTVHIDVGATPNSPAKPSSSSSTMPTSVLLPPSPALSSSSVRARTPSLQAPPATASVFSLSYRMLFAVATQDTVMIYDTQQAGPLCMFTNLHYAGFTDVAWAPDGQSLMLASSDGYCSIVIFDEFLPLYHTQQHHMQLQAIANSVATPQHTHHPLPTVVTQSGPSLLKKSELLTPADEQGPSPKEAIPETSNSASPDEDGQPRKKKRRIQLTHHGNIE
ncbi:hypothetical protein BS47DRAFT_1341543 [Hydnum rufescens UP504]|uniref:CAF1B/HIR1 beta-propeller domain-containing protein n=1 Tax=Hydnum rufescens UP504 TaxID=1448309 RepID=A0A9P6B1Z5_9AGAM|nr:hypothetical protein BS47DRAFT_1341543 [Hydnum rufescens UP504]